METYSSTKIAVKYSTGDPIQTKPVSSPHTTNMLYTNVSVDDNYKSFATTRKLNHSATATSNQILLVSDTLQYQHNTTTHMTLQKLPPRGKENIFFKITVKLTRQHGVTNQGH